MFLPCGILGTQKYSLWIFHLLWPFALQSPGAPPPLESSLWVFDLCCLKPSFFFKKKKVFFFGFRFLPLPPTPLQPLHWYLDTKGEAVLCNSVWSKQSPPMSLPGLAGNPTKCFHVLSRWIAPHWWRALASGNNYLLIPSAFLILALQSTAAAIKAIRESGMDLNPEADGPIIRVPIPK